MVQELNCKKLGIYRKSPHKIRKTYGTDGHTDISSTENHYHRNRRSIDAKSQIISSLPEFMTN